MPSYNEGLLDRVPVTDAQRQAGYNIDILNIEEHRTASLEEPKRQSVVPPAPRTYSPDHDQAETGDLPRKDYSYSPNTVAPPWYKTRKWRIILSIAGIVIVAAVVGGAVGGTAGHHSSSNTDVASSAPAGGAGGGASMTSEAASKSTDPASSTAGGGGGGGTPGDNSSAPPSSTASSAAPGGGGGGGGQGLQAFAPSSTSFDPPAKTAGVAFGGFGAA